MRALVHQGDARAHGTEEEGELGREGHGGQGVEARQHAAEDKGRGCKFRLEKRRSLVR